MAGSKNILPTNLPTYVGVSVWLFDEMVADRRMPKPIRINSRVLWDRLRLDAAFSALSDTDRGADDAWSKCAL